MSNLLLRCSPPPRLQLPAPLARLVEILIVATRQERLVWSWEGDHLRTILAPGVGLTLQLQIPRDRERHVTDPFNAFTPHRAFARRVNALRFDLFRTALKESNRALSCWYPVLDSLAILVDEATSAATRTITPAMTALVDALTEDVAALCPTPVEPDHLPPPDAGSFDIAATPEAVTSSEAR